MTKMAQQIITLSRKKGFVPSSKPYNSLVNALAISREIGASCISFAIYFIIKASSNSILNLNAQKFCTQIKRCQGIRPCVQL